MTITFETFMISPPKLFSESKKSDVCLSVRVKNACSQVESRYPRIEMRFRQAKDPYPQIKPQYPQIKVFSYLLNKNPYALLTPLAPQSSPHHPDRRQIKEQQCRLRRHDASIHASR
jgi:hypothetical protein